MCRPLSSPYPEPTPVVVHLIRPVNGWKAWGTCCSWWRWLQVKAAVSCHDGTHTFALWEAAGWAQHYVTHRHLVLTRWEEEGGRGGKIVGWRSELTSVWARADFTHSENKARARQLHLLTASKCLLCFTSFLIRPRHTISQTAFLTVIYCVYKKTNSWHKVDADSPLTAQRAQEMSRSSIFSETSQFPTVPWEGLVDLGSWCPCLLPINHQLQAAVLKNFWFPTHIHTLTYSPHHHHHHAHTLICLLTNTLLPPVFIFFFQERATKSRGSSVCAVRPMAQLSAIWVLHIKCGLFLFWRHRLEQKKCLMCGTHVQAQHTYSKCVVHQCCH